MESLKLSTKTYNYFRRAGANTKQDVIDICDGKKSRKNIPESCILEARTKIFPKTC